jgi:hypothetical protein
LQQVPHSHLQWRRFSPVAFAQTGGYGGQNWNSYSNNAGANYDNGTGANNGMAANNGENPWRFARDVKAQINDARNNGENVGLADHDYVTGMNDLQNGNQTAAMARFRETQDVLNNQGTNNQFNGEANAGNAGWSNGYENSNLTLRQRCDQLKNQIDQARDQDLDVSAADHQYFLGMRDMRNGDDTQAMRHFNLAEQNLDSEGFNGGRNASWSGNNNGYGTHNAPWSGEENDAGNTNPEYNTRTNNTSEYNASNTTDYSKTSRMTNPAANGENGSGYGNENDNANENGSGYQNSGTNSSWSNNGNGNAAGNMNPQQMRQQLKESIFTAREQGVNVTDSNHEYRRGVHALDQGNNQAAMQYFDQARNDLSQEENGNSNQGNMGANQNNAGNNGNTTGTY